MFMSMEDIIHDLGIFLYGKEEGPVFCREALKTAESYRERLVPSPNYHGAGFPLNEDDSFIITYGDSIRSVSRPPLETLNAFLSGNLRPPVSGVHILPFFPYTSDDGFSVSDYRKVNPSLGGWEDIRALGRSYRLMGDLVLNHCSVKSDAFKKYLAGDPKYSRYFIEADKDSDLSAVVRPRTHPLLTPYETKEGIKHIWTTFSADQVDLNFAHPPVLLEMLDILLFYISQGIQVIRLDAIAYLWKEPGHPCVHHEKTHAVVKFFRAILRKYAPWAVLLTETNVPHKENISYFGDGSDEAHMVYQFPLPPLVLDTFLKGNCSHLLRWASGLKKPAGNTAFFNFLASHDGIGVQPLKGILSPEELDSLIRTIKDRGGFVSYKATPDGNIPYELNINYLDALAPKQLPAKERSELFLAAQSILLAMPGVPGIYIHSLLGSGNWPEGVSLTGMNRSINRQKLSYEELLEDLGGRNDLRYLVYKGYCNLLKVRRSSLAFDPLGGASFLPSDGKVFPFLRYSQDGKEKVLCVVNCTGTETRYTLSPASLGFPKTEYYFDLIAGNRIDPLREGLSITLALRPYQVLWITPEEFSRDGFKGKEGYIKSPYKPL